MEYTYLTIERKDHAALVTLNRPDRMNALNQGMMDEILRAAESFRTDEATRVVIFTGAGRTFSAGVDLADPVYLQHVEKDSALMRLRFFRQGARMVEAIHAMDQITLAAVNGDAVGGGACIAAACDFRIGADNCRIGYPEVGLGMNLSWGALAMCVRLIGPARAKRMIILAQRESAETLQRWGYLDEVAPAGALMDRVWEMAQSLAARPPVAAQMAKRSVNAVASALDRAVMHMDGDQFSITLNSRDCREGIAAFLEKRKGHFIGD